MITGASEGSIRGANPCGWSNESMFAIFLQELPKPTIERRVKLIVDNHKKPGIEQRAILLMDKHESHI